MERDVFILMVLQHTSVLFPSRLFFYGSSGIVGCYMLRSDRQKGRKVLFVFSLRWPLKVVATKLLLFSPEFE